MPKLIANVIIQTNFIQKIHKEPRYTFWVSYNGKQCYASYIYILFYNQDASTPKLKIFIQNRIHVDTQAIINRRCYGFRNIWTNPNYMLAKVQEHLDFARRSLLTIKNCKIVWYLIWLIKFLFNIFITQIFISKPWIILMNVHHNLHN